jgi:hypothetical protein
LRGVRSSRLMLARNCDLCLLASASSLVLDFFKQLDIFDGDHRLVGEGGDQLDLSSNHSAHQLRVPSFLEHFPLRMKRNLGFGSSWRIHWV